MSIRGLRVWFVVSGCIGIVVAFVLAHLASTRSLSPGILLPLWPASIVGLSDPSTLTAKIIISVCEFAGNFLLYGIVGTVFGFALRLLRP